MFRAKRNTVALPNAKVMAAALAEVRAVQLKYDARLMWLLFLNRATLVGQQLKALGIETDESLDAMFKSALDQAKAPIRVQPKVFDPDAQPTGKAS